MKMVDNPFLILGIAPEDSLETIEEAADNKSFMDEENQAKYEEARSMLTYPQKRLAAEVRWFYSDPDAMTAVDFSPVNDMGEQFSLTHRETALYCAEKLYRLDASAAGDDRVATAASFIKRMDNGYFHALNQDEVQELFEEINDARREAGFPEVKDMMVVSDQLRQALSEDCSAALQQFMDSNDIGFVAEVVREIVKKQIAAHTGKQGKHYHDVIVRLIDLYNAKVSSYLIGYQTNIENEIATALNYTETSQLAPLFEQVRNFEYYAEPLQLYFLDIGQPNKQSQSLAIAYGLRNLAIDFHNEKQRSDMSLAIAQFERPVFYALPEITEKLDEDIQFLQSNQKNREFYNILITIRDEVGKLVVRTNGHEATNKQHILTHQVKWLAQLRQAAALLPTAGTRESREMNMALAGAYFTVAIACTWGELWKLALNIAQLGLPYAQAGGDAEQIRDFQKVIREFSSTLQALSQQGQLESSGESSSGGKKYLFWLVIIVIGVLVIWGMSSVSSNKHVSTTSKPLVTSSQKAAKEKAENIEYQEPPVGKGREFNTAEMHWAAREKIRLDTMKPLIKNDEGIAAFNKMVDNYNSRAGSFKYRRNSWQDAKADVEAHRDEIVAEAKKEIHDSGWDVEEENSAAPAAPAFPRASGPAVSADFDDFTAPAAIFKQYHLNITNRNFRRAWNCLTGDFRNQLDYSGWVSGYRTTVRSTPSNILILSNDGQTATLSFNLEAVDNVNGNYESSYYDGTCSLINVNGTWKIDSIEASKA